MVTDALFHASTENEKVTTFRHGVRVRMCVSVSAASTQHEFVCILIVTARSVTCTMPTPAAFGLFQSSNTEHRSWEVL